MIYLASPYSDPDPDVRNLRYSLTKSFCAWKIKHGYFIYSPIVHCHWMASQHNLPKDAEFWHKYNVNMLRRADAFWILQLEGWQFSVGIGQEKALADKLDLPQAQYQWPLS